jgi:hypothetical protein
MEMVKVYQFEKYDIDSDGMRKSRRWGTREAIESIHGKILEETVTEVDKHVVSSSTSDLLGFSLRDYNPHQQHGFQRQVR